MLDHKLTIFYHTAKHLNTTKAAEILRLSQPAISKSIKELEKGLGITLLIAEGRLMLTPAGKYLLEQSEELIERERIITFNLQHMKKSSPELYTSEPVPRYPSTFYPNTWPVSGKLIPISK